MTSVLRKNEKHIPDYYINKSHFCFKETPVMNSPRSKYSLRFSLPGILLLAAFLISPGKATAQDVDYKSYTLFVYNFIKYIEWPEESAKGDFVIGVLGDSPILKELQGLASTKKARGRNIVIRQLQKPEELSGCHLVYIISKKSGELKKLLELTTGKPVLLVAEREGLARKGAALSFATMDDDVLKFEINKSVLEKHSLRIPSVLMALGLVVG